MKLCELSGRLARSRYPFGIVVRPPQVNNPSFDYSCSGLTFVRHPVLVTSGLPVVLTVTFFLRLFNRKSCQIFLSNGPSAPLLNPYLPNGYDEDNPVGVFQVVELCRWNSRILYSPKMVAVCLSETLVTMYMSPRFPKDHNTNIYSWKNSNLFNTHTSFVALQSGPCPYTTQNQITVRSESYSLKFPVPNPVKPIQ